MREKFLVFGAPDLQPEDIEAVLATLNSKWIGTGPKATEFEQTFSAYTRANHAVALSSCTAALHLAMLASGIEPGDEVITSPMTFCATANAIVHAGAIPVFADIDPLTGLIDPSEIEKKISSKTKAIIPIHLCGRPCDMTRISELARVNQLKIIEDCAHAIETEYHGTHAGTFGEAGCFSFYVTKNVTAIEGGMIVTNQQDLANRVKILAMQGMSADAWDRYSDRGFKHYQVTYPGFKYNLPDVHAALALSQLSRVEENQRRRESIWRAYDRAFQGYPCFIPPPDEPNTRHARHLYTLLLDLERLTVSRDRFLDELHARNIGSGIHYISLHLHHYYRERFNFVPSDFPNAFWHSERTLSLPLSPSLTGQDVDDVIQAVVDIFNQFRK